MDFGINKKTCLRALVPVALAFVSAGIVVVGAGPTYVVADDNVAVSQNAIMLRFLWAQVFPFLMLPFIFWIRHKAMPEQRRRATLAGIVSAVLASILNYFLL